MIYMSLILAALFMGISFLAYHYASPSQNR